MHLQNSFVSAFFFKPITLGFVEATVDSYEKSRHLNLQKKPKP